MIASLRGKLLFSTATKVVVECGGVGFDCFATKSVLGNLPAVGEELFLHTYLSVREDAMDLYAFSSADELEAFKLITSVNGVGAKIGIAILSEFTSERLYNAISTGDAKIITAAQGVGLKLAQRIVLELKDKIGSVGDLPGVAVVGNNNTSAASEAVEALIALGYTKGEASLAIAKLDGNLPTDQLIKQALTNLARGI